MTATANTAPPRDTGKGLALPGLIVGLLTGFAAYGIAEFWIDGRDENALGITALFFTTTAAAAYLLLAERGAFLKAIGGAVFIAALLAPSDFFMARVAGADTNNLAEFPTLFWFFISRGLAAYLLVTLIKAGMTSGAPPAYAHVFFHGLTMPLIAGGAKLFAALALVLLFAWARLLKELDVNFFNDLFQEPWFLLPFLGAIGGLSIALMRGLQSVLGALQYVLLLLCRILMIITAVFTVTLLLVIALKGVALVFDRPYPSAWMMGLSLVGMLIFNGVYQNGEGGPPPLWLRIPTLITLIGFPVYTLIAFYAFWIRIDDYGLTPPRIAGLAVNGLIAAYSVVCFAGLATELNWRGKKWMPLVGSLNTVMAALWVLVLVTLASPLANPWAISAKSQYALIAGERIAIDEFDFGYMRFKLGKYGDRALEKMLTLDDHPEIEAIRAGVKRARSSKNYWEYQNVDLEPAPENDGGG
ncbi:hypothetical protein [Hyphococcus sp.]|uniref:hypothetical protein n=1 Tax=Hyphococcus sp. TaxID=2038636 RepID=UPI003CCC364D